MTLHIQSIRGQNGYEVCLTEDGFTECCHVPTVQLVDKTEVELRATIRRRAFNAFIEAKSK